MKHIKLFEQFINESAITLTFDDATLAIKPTDGKADPSMPQWKLDDKKKGWVYSAMGSAGEETRIVAKCDPSKEDSSYQATKAQFTGKSWSNWNAMQKEVSDFLKKNC